MPSGEATKHPGRFGDCFMLKYPPAARLGIWNSIDDPWALGNASQTLDFIVIDLEHGFRDFSRFASTFVWLSASNEMFVRVRSTVDPWLQSLLDLGVENFLLPQVESADEVEEFAKRTILPPAGRRGIHPRSRINMQAEGGFSRINLFPIIETELGLQQVEALLQLDEVAGLYFGAYDLASNLGLAGPEDSVLLGLMRSISSACLRNQKSFMCMPMDGNQLEVALEAKSTHYLVGIDTEILARAVSTLVSGRAPLEPK